MSKKKKKKEKIAKPPSRAMKCVAAWLKAQLWIVNLFFQYKFMTIFSILFGVGAAIQWKRARLAGRNFDSFFLKRMAILFGFGVIHALFFWYGDILAVYALCGVWLLLFCRLSNPQPMCRNLYSF